MLLFYALGVLFILTSSVTFLLIGAGLKEGYKSESLLMILPGLVFNLFGIVLLFVGYLKMYL